LHLRGNVLQLSWLGIAAGLVAALPATVTSINMPTGGLGWARLYFCAAIVVSPPVLGVVWFTGEPLGFLRGRRLPPRDHAFFTAMSTLLVAEAIVFGLVGVIATLLP
jgi:hypothetical protein